MRKKTPKTVAQNMQSYRDRQLLLGRKPRSVYLTDKEFPLIKKALYEIRAGKNGSGSV